MDVESTLAEVGPRLKRLRQERGSTLAALSERTGISVSTLSRLESGQRRRPWNCCSRWRRCTRCRSTSWSARRR